MLAGTGTEFARIEIVSIRTYPPPIDNVQEKPIKSLIAYGCKLFQKTTVANHDSVKHKFDRKRKIELQQATQGERDRKTPFPRRKYRKHSHVQRDYRGGFWLDFDCPKEAGTAMLRPRSRPTAHSGRVERCRHQR